MSTQKHFYTIPSNHAFVDSLAAGIHARFGKQMEQHSDMLLLLPNRRSAQALKDAFLRQSEGQATLLPRMIPLGDMDEDEINLLLLSQEKALDIPSPIAPVRQQLLLAQLTHQWRKVKYGEEAMFVHSLKLAGELVRFLSEVERERLTLENLEQLYPEEFQAHWQDTLDFLKILMENWPEMLKEQDALTVAQYRNQMLELQAELWRENPPNYPVIAAGAAGTVPAVSDLLSVIADMPHGYVVLPGLDQHLEQDAWDVVSETHPQYEMKQLLAKAECAVDGVELWQHDEQFQTSPAARKELVSQLMRPAEKVDAWRSYIPVAEAFANVSLTEAATLHEEAGMIALMLREVLETDGKTAALVTHNRSLARHVVVALQRWHIRVNDSAGKPLAETPLAVLLRSVAALLEKDADIVTLLSCLKHPYSALGYTPLECLNHVRKLEQYYLRGVCRARTAEALLSLVKNSGEDEKLVEFLERVCNALAPLDVLRSKREGMPLLTLFDEVVAVAQMLAVGENEDEQSRLWSGDAAEQLQEWYQQLQHIKDLPQEVDVSEARNLMEALMEGVSFRPRYGLHPRLHILGPLEARLQQYDRLILGGLNEGSWPSLPSADPWMSRPMRAQFGLPLPERRIGQAAHDFMQYFCAKEVILTRSRKIDGAETSPSRWWMRLDAVLKASGNAQALTSNQPWNEWYQFFYEVEERNATQPAPLPPLVKRPRKLSVTKVEMLQQNPYAIYARYILKLKKLDEVDKVPGTLEFGNLIHKTAEEFSKIAWHEHDGKEAVAKKWIDLAEDVFEQQQLPATVKAVWWPRVERIALELAEMELERREHIKSLYSELKGSYQFETKGGTFTLSTEADRLEIDRENALHVIDYKTGTPPSEKKIDAGEKSQLPLEAMIAMRGRFGGMKETPESIKELAYWKVSGRKEALKVDSFPKKKEKAEQVENWIKEAEEGLKKLVEWFDDETHPYLAYPFGSDHLSYDDYAHLIREDEWDT